MRVYVVECLAFYRDWNVKGYTEFHQNHCLTGQAEESSSFKMSVFGTGKNSQMY